MHNNRRIASMQTKSIGELKRVIDSGSLSSAAATFWLKQRFDIVYNYTRRETDSG